MKVVLISTYELGRQPFGLASPAAWLRENGADVVVQDLAIQRLEETSVSAADLVALYVPMHTATRLAARVAERVRGLNPKAHLCFYGLYAPMNEAYLRGLGGETILGGEFEEGLLSLVKRLAGGGDEASESEQIEPRVSLGKQRFLVPDRKGLPLLDQYAQLQVGPERRVVGYTEASRGCKHLCRHCPVVPVYEGNFRIVQREVVLEDVRRQVAAGAQHVTFGDPDFFNGPAHAVALVRALHDEFPDVTYDVTIKVEHLLKQRRHLAALRETGCLFITCAVEAIDDATLEIFDKGHTREDFIEVVSLLQEEGLTINPTFVTFTPWTTLQSYRDLLGLLFELDLVDNLSPVQYGIRLLIPAGSKLLELSEVQDLVEEFDQQALIYPWKHSDPRVDELCRDILRAVQDGQALDESRRDIFLRVWKLTEAACESKHESAMKFAALNQAPVAATIPYLTEPWYC